MAKVLISLLGTGRQAKDEESSKYEVTDYKIENKVYKNLTFLSNAIIQHKNIEKVFFIGTNKSMWDNIAETFKSDDDYIMSILEKKETNSLVEEDLIPLNNLIDEKLNSKNSKCFIVKDGENEEELWHIFEKFIEILDLIDEKDEVYFDITHLFRSLSVMSFVMAEFGQISKNIQIKGLYYGMFKKNEPSLIIDMSMFFELLEWSKAIEEMEKFASLNRLVNLSNTKIAKNGFNALINMEQAFDIANMTAIFKSINRLKNHLNYFSENENKIIRLIAPRIEKFITKLSKNRLSDFQFELASFFAEKHYHSIAYIALAEAVVTKVCEKRDLNTNDKNDREQAKNILYKYKSYPFNSIERKFWEIYFKQINRIRNNIAHQLETTKQPKDDISNFKKYFDESRKYLKELL